MGGLGSARRVLLRKGGRVNERVGIGVDAIAVGLGDAFAILNVRRGNSAVTVVCVFAQADIGSEKKSREKF